MSVVPVFKQPATWTPRRLVREAQILCRIGASVDAAAFLGSDSAGVERDETLSTIVNLSLEEFFRDFPHLNVVTAGSTTTALDPFSDLPADLHESDIQGIYWNESGEACDGHIVRSISEADIRHMPPNVQAGRTYAEWPMYYAVAFDHTTGLWKLRFLPTPNAAKDYIIVYRAQPTKYEYYDFGATTDATFSVTIGSGAVTAVTVTNGGSGYNDDNPPAVSFTGGGTPTDAATATATVVDGVITAITMGLGGEGYTGTPTVVLTDGRAPVIPVPDSQIEPLVYLVAERIQQRNTGAKSLTPETLRAQYETFKKQRAYIQPSDDELRNGSFSPVGVPSSSGYEDKARFEASANIYTGDSF